MLPLSGLVAGETAVLRRRGVRHVKLAAAGGPGAPAAALAP